ncbi:DUF4238 domain-containing protein [Aeromonas dhakensis]|uniref:DUF4238 domain-containing protein n=1 Tax=Aeromonas dhakensis TaxID=196024 RepID=UPI000E3BFD58|nr:DUF4238 domain-containing protein [Aeromonas dhakensis]RFS20876.1 hypothetical protein DYE42_19620 [Aeromonas dhakensis]
MKYTKNQHMLSQWVLRNFRSDDTALQPKDKQRVWCHTVYPDENNENDIKEIPLPISSVAISKDCFMLVDGETGEKFDIEKELSSYEKDTSIIFNELVHEHEFRKLLNVNERGNHLEKMVNFMIIQMFLGFLNPQNRMEGKGEILSQVLEGMMNSFQEIKDQLLNPPPEVKPYFTHDIFRKALRVVNSTSEIFDKCKALFFLFMLAEVNNIPTLFCHLDSFRKYMFSKINITGIYHTGYDFDSTETRPVFTISPNVIILNPDNDFNLLPLAHNLAIGFSLRKHSYYNSYLNIFSVEPNKLKCKSSESIRIFKVSHDYIDGITGWVSMIGVSQTNTMYTPYELKDIERYLKLQNDNYDSHYTPEHPELVIVKY